MIALWDSVVRHNWKEYGISVYAKNALSARLAVMNVCHCYWGGGWHILSVTPNEREVPK